ncbi:serine/threonine-protein phosphatase 2A regulatory subunit B'' subunit beta-like isoform X1 [Diaphorina citri]|uniref:Serine/threonine-protein phosphatase 2A regulatory subunit B'' subunit beta-like isoform X1 n=1 Tax=Diaphorina citri TaxID=121845 RepID=A0A1S3DM21_DIACI|nr:serine/threonine-protein phosphatase 2A regulatory subunit B'' subunit beta-like isoform X2 [Diaphorina citri]XP_026687342.1 serine/threonine-protein phosphatase 2A regulatory subunit B'' subunit beta-like isoform X1 [Diaphorina citri]
MDLDGDGYLSMYELEYFYDEQLQRMDAIGIECLPFEDCLCQMLDMIKPEVPGKISLQDLKRCKMTRIFFDTFFNLEKYLDHEQRDPFASQRDDDSEMSDWDRFASEEYDMLVVEEGGNDNQDDMMYMDQEPDLLSPNLDQILYWNRQQTSHIKSAPGINGIEYEGGMGGGSLSSDDSGDYADSDDDCSL